MVVTRSVKAIGKDGNEGKTVAESEAGPSTVPSTPLVDSTTAPPAPSQSRPVSTSSRSSSTVVARRLAAEAQHARRLVELEAQQIRHRRELEREAAERQAAERQAAELDARRLADLERVTADLELKAEIAAIEADASRHSSRSSHVNIDQWFCKSEAAFNHENTLINNNIFRDLETEAPRALVASPARTATVRRDCGAAITVAPFGRRDYGAAMTAAPLERPESGEVPQLIKSLGVLVESVNKGIGHAINRVPLPRFDGKSHLDWLGLKKAFENTQGSYTAANNLSRLNTALTGAAREAVAALLVSARDPGVVLNALDARFGRPEIVVAHEVAAVRALPRVSAEAAHVEVDDDEPVAGTSGTAPRAPTAHAAAPTLMSDSASYDVESKEILTHTSTSVAAGYSAQTLPPLPPRPLLKIVAVTVSGPLGSVNAYAMLDDGATGSFIEQDIAAQIGACGPQRRMRLDCVGGLGKDTYVQYVDFHIKGRRGKDTYYISKARAMKGLGLATQTPDRSSVLKFSHLSDIADEFCYGNIQPSIIVGLDNWHLTIPRAIREGSRAEPVAINTALGWVLFAFGCSKAASAETVNHAIVSEPAVADVGDRAVLEQLIREQYSLDSIGISKREARSDDNDRAVQILDRTACRLPNGHFEVGLLWKSDNLSVPDSRKLALSRFFSLENKMARDFQYADRYRANIHDMLRKGYAELCTEEPSAKSPVWVLPHFGVTNPNKPNKLRVVHDAAAKSHGVSLNSLLLTGPDLLQPLLGILLRFREGKIALTGDVREMFPQVKIRPEDRDAQRFLWRDSPKDPIMTYRMSSMIFGAASSPFTAIYIKNKNAVEWQERFPDAVRAIMVDHYMDDCIVSLNSVDEAAKLAAEITNIHKHAGFEMRAWTSNNPSALRLLPKESLAEVPVASNDVDVDLGRLTAPVRTLGLIWQPVSDKIGFNIGIKGERLLPNKLTKREVLAHVMRVFDPLGILAPVVITGRIMFQNAWRKGIDWDEELSQSDSAAWRLWFEDLYAISGLQIPRCYCLGEYRIDKCELHLFCDASESAFAAVAYWRFVLENGEVKLALICSKVRVAPLKQISINRLELQGALIAARLASTICEAHRFKPVNRIFWCDSMTVLGWLRSEARLFKPFVSHRVAEIMEITDVKEWRWVPSQINVADDATRIKRVTLSSKSRWISGPEFLLSSEWPSEPSSPEYPGMEEESKRAARPDLVHLISDVEKHDPVSADPKRFSSWVRLVRATALAHKYLSLLRTHCLTRKGLCVDNLVRLEGGLCSFVFQPFNQWQQFAAPRSVRESAAGLTAADLRLAELHILRQSQLNTFPDEMASLDSHPAQLLPRTSRLSKLSVTIGDDGLMRLSGRIRTASQIRDEMKNPIVLDGKDPAVRLLVEHHHRRATHANTETVVNELRQDYHLLSLRSTVRNITYNCLFCRIRRAKQFQPVTGDLPEARLGHHKRPFTFTGLDYFGPVQVSIGRRREKRYVALYTCLVVRAVHLEIVDSLSTDSAIMSLRRFIARRGTPSELWSDNGTAFVGASRELRRLYDDATSQFAAAQRINWRFIPPAAPFMGGCWERLVKSVKTALKVTLTERAPTDEVLRTLLAEAEALVNSRPLTHVSVDPQSEESLTPMHFLLGTSSGRPIPATSSETDLLSRSSWRKAVRLSEHFWRRWLKEYLPTLIPRRGRGEVPQIAIGDLVLIADGNTSRGSWLRGRVTAVFPGPDGIIRVADVHTNGGILRRPLRKLVKLPL
ncbi:uncharacterized protein LOC134750352 [Cydia strobilella]|uniref:uncharacterized protein LOC134750352 n=1 Tax=Cydia strobilella TaxID=1100964 RepID=UPI003003D63F